MPSLIALFAGLTLIYLALVIEFVMAPVWRLGTVTPDLLGTLTIVWLTHHKRTRDLTSAALVGLLVDASAGDRLGIAMAAYLTIGACLVAIPAGTAPRSTLGWLGWIGAGITALHLMTALIAWCLGDTSDVPMNLLLRVLATGAYSALIAAPATLMWQRMRPRPRRVGRPEHRAWQSLATP